MLRSIISLTTTAAVLVLGLAAYVRYTGLSALPVPGMLEVRAARFVRGFAVPDDVRTRTNPIPGGPATLETGMAHFADHCASCHANDGGGAVQMGRNLYPKAPDMRLAATQALTDGELFWIIENGVRFTGMPGWATGTAEGEADSWRLVHFIRHLPELTEGERMKMEALNPKSLEQVRQEIEQERFLRGETR